MILKVKAASSDHNAADSSGQLYFTYWYETLVRSFNTSHQFAQTIRSTRLFRPRQVLTSQDGIAV